MITYLPWRLRNAKSGQRKAFVAILGLFQELAIPLGALHSAVALMQMRIVATRDTIYEQTATRIGRRMELTPQILLGTALLSLCAIVHVALVAKSIQSIPRISQRLERIKFSWRMPLLVGIAFAMVVFSHTIQVWIWAGMFLWQDTFSDWPTSVYFSLVTYTTLGYGDITLGEGHRVFAAFSAVTGLLTFGLSTAFLVGLVTHLIGQSPNFEGSFKPKQ